MSDHDVEIFLTFPLKCDGIAHCYVEWFLEFLVLPSHRVVDSYRKVRKHKQKKVRLYCSF